MDLLSYLLGGGAGAPAAAQTPDSAAPFITDPQGYVVPNPALKTPQAPAATPAPTGPAPTPYNPGASHMTALQSLTNPSQGNSNPNAITVTALRPDDWKPHKAGILGQIADYILGTHFGDENYRRNMEGALQAPNQMAAIRRIAEFDPQAAEKYYNQQLDNERMQGTLERQNKMLDLTNENLVYNRAASAMANATPDTWGPMREQIIKMGQARGVDMNDLIPTEYDPTAIETMRYGAVPVKAQIQEAETARHHGVTERIGQQNANSRQMYDEAAAHDMPMRTRAIEQNAASASQNAQSQQERTQAYVRDHPNPGGVDIIRDPQGNPVGQRVKARIGGVLRDVAIVNGRHYLITTDPRTGRVTSSQDITPAPPQPK